MQFSLRTLLIGACLVGPAVLLARRLSNLNYLEVTVPAIGAFVLAAVLIPQAVLLRVVTRSLKD